jgi:hypothetical protein
MADQVAAALDLHFQASHYTDDDDRAFCHPETGHYLDASKVRRRFQAAAQSAGVRAVRFHDLRHTFGTSMASAGAPMRDLMAWMGHADFATTLRTCQWRSRGSCSQIVARQRCGWPRTTSTSCRSRPESRGPTHSEQRLRARLRPSPTIGPSGQKVRFGRGARSMLGCVPGTLKGGNDGPSKRRICRRRG